MCRKTIMWNVNSVLAIMCFFGVFQGGSALSLGSLNRYLVDTWTGSQGITNNEASIAAQAILTGGSQKVVIVIHGRESSSSSEFAIRVREAFLNNDASRTTAVVRLDWSVVTSLGYPFASTAVPDVAMDLAWFIETLDRNGKLNRELLHIVGFDLGSHVAGIASRQPFARAKKVTGLNPAGDNWGLNSYRLNGTTDSDYVEVIHTDGFGRRAYGIGEDLGGLNFFPNGGTEQPGCSSRDNLCSHNRAWRLFAASLEYSPSGHLVGEGCEDMDKVIEDRCSGPNAVMGTAELEKTETGIYRLSTGREFPY